MTANGIKVLEALSKMDEPLPSQWWWRASEIARVAGVSPRGIGAVLSALYYLEECLRRSYSHPDRLFIYQINEKGLEIARASD